MVLKNKLNERSQKILLGVLFIIAPVVIGSILGLLNGTSIFKLDAIFNQFSNDEIVYFRAIKQMRLFGLPLGYNGYDERVGTHLAFGYYNYVTYFLYFIFSFVTNIDSHNYIYVSNILFLLLSSVAILIIVKPSVKQLTYLVIFNCFSVFLINGCFSGMSEGQHIFGISIIISLTVLLYLNDYDRKTTTIMILSIWVITMYFGIIRPTMLLFYVYIVFYFIFVSKENIKSKILFITSTILLFFVGLYLYLFLNKNFGAPYFYNDGYMQADYLLAPYKTAFSDNGILGVVETFATTNLNHFITIVKKYYNGFAGEHICIVLGLEFIFLVITLLSRNIKKNVKGLIVSSLVLVVSWFYIHMFVYGLVSMDRLFLVPMLAMNVIICIMDDSDLRKYFLILYIYISFMFTLRNRFAIKIPNNQLSVNTGALHNELVNIMPRSTSRWDNTIAFNIPPMKNDFFYFLIPEYMGEMYCSNNYLKRAINDNSFKSKYLLLEKNHSLYSDALNKKYEVIYDGLGYSIFKLR